MAEVPPSPSSPTRESFAASDDPRFSAELLGYATDQLRAGWKEVRTDEMPDDVLATSLAEFREATLAAPRAIGKRIAESITANERLEGALAAGDGIAMLEALESERTGPPLDLAMDADKMEELVAPRKNRGFSDGVRHVKQLDDAADESVTIQFPAGVYAIGSSFMRSKKPFPKEVTILGAGMDSTLLLGGDFSPRSALERFTMRDCTVYTDDALTDVRGVPATIFLERVRLIGFDRGSGGSSAIETAGLALLCRDSVIEGGYGRSPIHSYLFDVRTPAMVVRFERCRLSRISLSTIRTEHSVAFVDCELSNLHGGLTAFSDSYPGVTFHGTSISLAPPGSSETRLDLNTLFPDWESRVVR